MYFSAYGGFTELLNTLIDLGADVNAAQGKGWTALMGAAQTGNYGLVKTLLDKGADPARKNGNGETALALAMKADKRNQEVIDPLTESGKKRK